jgi:hypothetical protein
MKIYVAVCQDRHSDIDVMPFRMLNDAREYCKQFAGDNLKVCRLNDEMKRSGWVFYGKFSVESDYVMVLERELG